MPISPLSHLPITQVKRDLMRLLTGIKFSGEHIVITKEGKAEGVLLSVDEYESPMETLAVLNDAEALADLKRARIIARGMARRKLHIAFPLPVHFQVPGGLWKLRQRRLKGAMNIGSFKYIALLL